MHCISCASKRKEGKPLLFKQTLRSRFTYLACQHFSFYAKKSLDRERPFSLALRVVSLFPCLSRLAPSVTRVVICVSRAFCSMDQEKRETARSLLVNGRTIFPPKAGPHTVTYFLLCLMLTGQFYF